MKLPPLPFFVLLYFLSLPLFSQSPLIIGDGQFQIDNPKKLILVTKQSNHTAIQSSVQLGASTFVAGSPINPIQAGTPYTVKSADMVDYTLYFTDNPIVSITVSHIEAINKDDEITGSMVLATTTDLPYNSTIGIKIRGASSSYFPKKSYRVQLKDDQDPPKNRDDELLGMRSDRRWLMLAMYNEPMRNNNKFSHDLWLDMHTPYYVGQEGGAGALSTIRSEYVEAFVNSEYRGVYLFTEDADEKQFKLKNKSGGGELYKGETRGSNNTFVENYPEGGMHNDYPGIAPSTDELWGGWELRHPGSTDWINIYNFTDFVIKSEDEDFRNHIGSKLHLDNTIDYFIFINTIRATDNTSQNTLLGKFGKDEPYFYGVWDLDGVMGISWNGERNPATSRILSNNLFTRLLDTDPQNFKLRLVNRWKSLRQGLLSTDTFKSRFFGYYQYLLGQGVYDRELLVREADNNNNPWDVNLLNFSQDQINYVDAWIDARFSYLDNYFDDINTPLPVKLASFQISNDENRVKVEWTVAESLNVSYFTVERSINGRDNWISLGNVVYTEARPGYRFTDPSPVSGINYYRLRTTDLDGSFDHSIIRSIIIDGVIEGRVVNFFPNPAKGILKYKSENPLEKIFSISLLNAYGIPVFNETNNPGNSFNVENILPGMYIAVINFEDGGSEHHKIVISN